jgi:hypothetical protein
LATWIHSAAARSRIFSNVFIRRLLISGDGVAGLTTAYWLTRQGVKVTSTRPTGCSICGAQGYRIHGELVNVDVDVSQAAVAKYRQT